MDKYITAAQLVEGTEQMLGSGYVYGCFGMWGCEQVYEEKLAQYPEQVGKWPKSTYVSIFGDRWVDCIGLIKFLASLRGNNALIKDKSYNPKYSDIRAIDWSANGTIERCTEVVDFDKMPEVPGMAVWKNGHIGVFIKTLPDGRKLVREAKGHKYGVVETTTTAWKKAGKLPYVDYSNTPTPTPTPGGKCMVELDVLKKGSKGSSVKSLQILLNGYGYTDQNGNKLVVDGSFGGKTDYAVKALQKKTYPACGEVDGVCGKKTWTKLIEG